MTKEEVRKTVQKELFVLQDLKYRDFHAKLIPSVDKEKVIGIRTPALRAYAKKFGKKEEAKQFLEILPHQYYEENNLHGLLIEQMKEYEKCVEELERFLPYIDNWATCDLLALHMMKKHRDIFIREVFRWIESDQPYTIRFGISMLMRHYLDEEFKTEYPEKVAAIRSEEYYVNMMCAWYFATALAKQREAALPYFSGGLRDEWVRKKAICKAIESRRVDDATKELLRGMR